MQSKVRKKLSVAEISALRLVAIESPDSNENTANWQSMCQQTVLRAQILLGLTFSYSFFLKFMGEWYEAGSVLI